MNDHNHLINVIRFFWKNRRDNACFISWLEDNGHLTPSPEPSAMNDSAATPCTLCTCPNCMAGYEANAYEMEAQRKRVLGTMKHLDDNMAEHIAAMDARELERDAAQLQKEKDKTKPLFSEEEMKAIRWISSIAIGGTTIITGLALWLLPWGTS